MKTSKLQKVAWVFFALVLTSSIVSAQGFRNGNRMYQNQNGNCLYQISGLSEKQQTQIQKMEDEHQQGMDELRNKRRSTASAIEQSEIRTEMLKKVETHRNSVKKVLTADQQKQYEQLHAYGNNGRNGQFANSRGNRNFAGRGNGNFARGNRGGGCYVNTNFRGKNGNFQSGNFRGNTKRNYSQSGGNNFRGRNANYGRGTLNNSFQRGNGRFNQQNIRTYNNQNSSDDGVEAIE